jgi:hypothetical protein
MNGSSYPNHEKSGYLGGLPASGPLRGTAGREVSIVLILILDPPRGSPVGGGGVHRNQGYRGLNPHNYIRACVIFIGKVF